MKQTLHQRLGGIHAATIVPMNADFSIDEAALVDHLTWVANTPGIKGVLINGHAGENFVLTADEKRRVVELARDSLPAECLITCGINEESSLAAAREAQAAEAAGADVLLVFPPNSFALEHDPRCPPIHHAYVRDACSLPLLLYGAAIGAGAMSYSQDMLLKLAEDERVVGIKDGSWEVATYEANWRLFEDRRDSFAVLGSGDEHLLTSYLIGTHGSQVSLAALAPALIAALYEAATAMRWDEARALHDKVYPLARAIYGAPPGGRATARIKAALKRLGSAFQRCGSSAPTGSGCTRTQFAGRRAAGVRSSGVTGR
jgi:4-hydroxy-tetrahydrodipicolinate synthase